MTFWHSIVVFGIVGVFGAISSTPAAVSSNVLGMISDTQHSTPASALSQTIVAPSSISSTTENLPETMALSTSTQPKSIADIAHKPEEKVAAKTTHVFDVPFYSQFRDISSTQWQKVGCGIASLAMIIDYYKPAVPVNTLLQEGIDADAYLTDAGWIHTGLIEVGHKYGLEGDTHNLASLSSRAALAELESYLADGPVIVSVHYKFEPTNPIPHLVVIDGIKDGLVYYNDPAASTGSKTISTTAFLKAWKKRFIVIRPTTEKVAFAR